MYVHTDCVIYQEERSNTCRKGEHSLSARNQLKMCRPNLHLNAHSAYLWWWELSNPSAVIGGVICIKSMHNWKETALHTVRIFFGIELSIVILTHNLLEKFIEGNFVTGTLIVNHYDWLIEWMVFYTAFNSISVISWRQLTLFMLSWVSPVLGWALKCDLPKDTPTKKPRGSSAATPGLRVKHFTTEPRGTLSITKLQV